MAYTMSAKMAKVAMALTFALVLSACNRQTALAGADLGSVGGDKTVVGPAASTSEVYKEEQPDEANTDPVEGPVNLPPIPTAPTTTVAPAQMKVRALAMTLTNQPAPGYGKFVTSIIRAKLTWTPVKGAAGYRVYQLAKSDANASGKGKLVFTTPRWMPFTLVGGGLAGIANLNVDQEYVYTIETLDRAGNVIASGQDNCRPLAPLTIPYLLEPGQNGTHVGQTPMFKWQPSRGADGYYCEVFSTIKNQLPAVPMWRGFRAESEADNLLYGMQADVMAGTRPIQWSLPLNVGTRYAWTVTAVRTDSHDMINCKAIARANAPLNYFLP